MSQAFFFMASFLASHTSAFECRLFNNCLFETGQAKKLKSFAKPLQKNDPRTIYYLHKEYFCNIGPHEKITFHSAYNSCINWNCRFYCIYLVKQFYIKESAEISIHSNERPANELRFAFKLKNNSSEEASFRWTDDDEFTYKGMMFDVSHKEIVADSIILYCINDSDELSLIENLKRFCWQARQQIFRQQFRHFTISNWTVYSGRKNELSFYPHQILMYAVTNSGGIVYMSYEILKPPPQLG